MECQVRVMWSGTVRVVLGYTVGVVWVTQSGLCGLQSGGCVCDTVRVVCMIQSGLCGKTQLGLCV